MQAEPVVFITGASQGIGLAVASHLSEVGYCVYGLVRTTSNTKQLDESIKVSNNKLHKIIGDVTSSVDIKKAVNKIHTEKGKIDVLINNACHVLVGTSESCAIEEQKISMDVNYFGAIRAQQAVLPIMRKQKQGHIINISSVAGFDPFPHLETYAATKSALESMTESLAIHLRSWGINVSLVEPSGVKTRAPATAPLGAREIEDTNAYQQLAERAHQQMVASYNESLDCYVIATLIEKILSSDDLKLRYQIGDYAIQAAKERFKDPSGNKCVIEKIALLNEKKLLAEPRNLLDKD